MKLLISNAHQRFSYVTRNGLEAIVLADIRHTLDGDLADVYYPLIGVVLDANGAYQDTIKWNTNGNCVNDAITHDLDIVKAFPTKAETVVLESLQKKVREAMEYLASADKFVGNVIDRTDR